MELINALKRDMEECLSEIRICILDCKSCFENFDIICFQHIGTHVLAKHVASSQSSIKWIGNYPRWLQRVVDHNAMNCKQEV